MSLYVRLLPAGALVLLVIVRGFEPGFMAQRVHSAVPVQWFYVVLLSLGYLAAWAITPPFVRIVNVVARRAFLPFAFFIILALGLLAFADASYAHLIRPWCTACPEWSILDRFSAVIMGG